MEGGVAAESDRWQVVRVAGVIALLVALCVAIWVQRSTVTGALRQISTLSSVAVVALTVLCAYERWSRADIVGRLIGRPVGIGRGLVIHDVGNAVSKGVPMGGALGTALRWQISKDFGVRPERFASMLVAYGIATTFASWLLPFVALAVDLVGRPADLIDVALLGGIAAVLVASVSFWIVVLRSERLERWAERRLRHSWNALARRVPPMAGTDPAAGVAAVRRELFAIGRRPWSLLGRTLAAQACGALILLVALRGLGVGPELATTEFLRVFFVAHLLGTFAPTPGGVGVIEAGVTGALVAAGVDTTTALAGVLVYRFITYIMPIALGGALYVGWRIRRRPSARERRTKQPSAPTGLVPTERGNVARAS